MYKNIIVGIDGSEFSKSALYEAASRIKSSGGNLTIVHAVSRDEEELSAGSHEMRLETGRSICYKARADAGPRFGVDMETIVCEGDPPEVIVRVAGEKNADLIVTGTYGKKGLKRLIMGSVTYGIITKSHSDVLVVKNPCPECKGRYDSILVSYDGSDFGKKALRRASELARADGAQLSVIYVIPRYEEMMDFFKTDAIKKSLRQEAEKIMSEARKIVSETCPGMELKTEVGEGQPDREIVESALELKNALIVMGSHGWRGVSKAIIGSTTERVILSAPCPVLVVK
ncbi:MAG: universal stress protein [Nitrospiraceae bacterium]|nr:universal stress protein [Nitrospiraceae bacterium]